VFYSVEHALIMVLLAVCFKRAGTNRKGERERGREKDGKM
jgi:hypothetical protein